tara:strand:- start:709 stop:1038 length:330 start_codon:yes stop_codon:yes gene_type:complete
MLYHKSITLTKGKKMKVLTLPYIDNASHGYIKISKYDLIGFKIFDKFSSFSYYKPETACFYLEEDCDALKLQRLLKEKNIELNTKDIYDPDFYFDSSYISADQVQIIGA